MARTTVRVGSARSDENGRARGGRAGDQNGREVSAQDWYKHPKGWVVLRPISGEAGRKIAWDMQAACDNPHIGYDQGERNTLYSAAKPYGFDCSKIAVNCETDCSSLVRVCCCYAGIMVGAFSTANEASVLLGTRRFKRMRGAQYTTRCDYLRAGDILVTASQGHTVVVLNDGPLAGADDTDEAAPANPTAPDGTRTATTCGAYWLRDQPGVFGRPICVIPSGTTLRVYGSTASGWYGVKLPNGRKGYVSGNALPAMKDYKGGET